MFEKNRKIFYLTVSSLTKDINSDKQSSNRNQNYGCQKVVAFLSTVALFRGVFLYTWPISSYQLVDNLRMAKDKREIRNSHKRLR